MKIISSLSKSCEVFAAVLIVTGVSLLTEAPAQAEEKGTNTATISSNSTTNSAEADKAWKEVVKASQPPGPRAEWKDKRPTEEEVAEYYRPLLIVGADKAKDFYTKYPDHAKANEARKKEHQLLTLAVQRFDATNLTERLEASREMRSKDPNLSEEEKLEIRMGAVHKLLRGLPDTLDELEKTSRNLIKEFPKQNTGYQLLMMVASQKEGEKGKELAQEIAANESAPQQARDAAMERLKQLDAVGKPVEIKFTAVDGRKVDLAEMKGKVVLVDFWATWCGPCVAEIPNVKEAYNKLHPKGFEIVGISFDQSKESLENFVKEKQMDWPQYFDGKGWENKYGQQYGIRGIPTMWLVDKQGKLRDANARGQLEKKVEKLLAE